MCAVSFVLAIAGLYGVVKKNMRILKFYFYWKCVEAIVIPIFELVIVFAEAGNDSDILHSSPSLTYYIIILCKAFLRGYFAYLIYSYYQRMDRGE